jgi:hypothetical protein
VVGVTGDIARRLDKIEAAYASRATVLRLEDGMWVFLPLGAMIDVSLAFSTLIHEGELFWRGEASPEEWIEAFARSVPEPGEGTITEACREWSRRYLNGEDLT